MDQLEDVKLFATSNSSGCDTQSKFTDVLFDDINGNRLNSNVKQSDGLQEDLEASQLDTFDAVLTAVHKLIEGLNLELAKDQTGIMSKFSQLHSEQVQSFDYDTNIDSTHSKDLVSRDHVTTLPGAQCKQQLVRLYRIDKEASESDWKTKNKNPDVLESRVESKENKDLFAQCESTLISVSKSNKLYRETEVGLERNSCVSECGGTRLKKQMTQEEKLYSSKNEDFIKEPAPSNLSLGKLKQSAANQLEPAKEFINSESTTIDWSLKSISSDIESNAYEEVYSNNDSNIADEVFHLSPGYQARETGSLALVPRNIPRLKKNMMRHIAFNEESTADSSSSQLDEICNVSSVQKSISMQGKNISNNLTSPSHIEENQDFKTSLSKFTNVFNRKSLNKGKAAFLKKKKIFRGFTQSDSSEEKKSYVYMNSKKTSKRSSSLDEKSFSKTQHNTTMWTVMRSASKMTTSCSKASCTMKYTRSVPSDMENDYFDSRAIKEDCFGNLNYLPRVNKSRLRQECITMNRIKSEPKLPPLQEDELENDVNTKVVSHDLQVGPNLSSSDCLLDSINHSKLMLDKNNGSLTPSFRRKFAMDFITNDHRERLASADAAIYSRRYIVGSQDSLLSDNNLMLQELYDQQRVDSFARLATFTKTKFRKTLKNVGKSSSFPTQLTNESPERIWIPDGDCLWRNKAGARIELESTNLQSLSELECDALKKLALTRLHDIDIGVQIVQPKDESLLLKRKEPSKKKYGVLASKEKYKDKYDDHVFGIPLIDVVENDQLLRLQKSFTNKVDCRHNESPTNEHFPGTAFPKASSSSSSSSSGNSSCFGSSSSINNQHGGEGIDSERKWENSSSDEEVISTVSSPALSPKSAESDDFNNKDSHSHQRLTPPSSTSKCMRSATSQSLRRRGAIAADSNSEIDQNQSLLLEALSRSVTSGTNQNHKKGKDRSMLPPTMPQVPYVVQKCCDHIKNYGLDVTGIFRIAGSKKRVKQLREEFDRGIDVTIDENYHPNDVAALLKEFFRDLPEALLTRELYPAFVQTAKMPRPKRLDALRYLLWLLPLSNRDTLYTLLNFLEVVAAHSETSHDYEGNEVPGNKMSARNLAVIFGPNILHRYKKSQAATDAHYQGPILEKPEESTAVVKVVEELITNQVPLFQIPKEDHNDMLCSIKETNPSAVDYLLRRKEANQCKNSPAISSSNSLHSNSSKTNHHLVYNHTPANESDKYLESMKEVKHEKYSKQSHYAPDTTSEKLRNGDYVSGDGKFVRYSSGRESYQQAIIRHIPYQKVTAENENRLFAKDRFSINSNLRCLAENHHENANNKCNDSNFHEENEKKNNLKIKNIYDECHEGEDFKRRLEKIKTVNNRNTVLPNTDKASYNNSSEATEYSSYYKHYSVGENQKVSPPSLLYKHSEKLEANCNASLNTSVRKHSSINSGQNTKPLGDLNNNKFYQQLHLHGHHHRSNRNHNNNNNNNGANSTNPFIEHELKIAGLPSNWADNPFQFGNQTESNITKPIPLPRTRFFGRFHPTSQNPSTAIESPSLRISSAGRETATNCANGDLTISKDIKSVWLQSLEVPVKPSVRTKFLQKRSLPEKDPESQTPFFPDDAELLSCKNSFSADLKILNHPETRLSSCKTRQNNFASINDFNKHQSRDDLDKELLSPNNDKPARRSNSTNSSKTLLETFV